MCGWVHGGLLRMGTTRWGLALIPAAALDPPTFFALQGSSLTPDERLVARGL